MGVPGAQEAPARAGGRTRRRRWIRAALVAVIALLGLGVVGAVTQRTDEGDGLGLTAELDGPAPGFRLESVRPGEPEIALTDFLGRPVVLNVWASWCAPCRREMPALAAAQRRFGDRVGFVGVNHQDTRDLAIELLDDTGVGYPSAFDPDGTVARDYGLFGMPTTIFIGADGQLLERRTGELSPTELKATIERLFLSS
ncbi:MAG: TlpA family protein disulfide reductase [Acidimicrobiia bacterium]